MLVPSSQTKSIQRALFAEIYPRPEWRELSPDVKEKMPRFAGTPAAAAGPNRASKRQEEEACDEGEIRSATIIWNWKAILYVRQSSRLSGQQQASRAKGCSHATCRNGLRRTGLARGSRS